MTQPSTDMHHDAAASHRPHVEAAVLRDMIASIPPDQSRSGRIFLQRLLDARGPEGVEAFVQKLKAAELNRADVSLDAVEKELLSGVYLRVMDRRVFMDCLRWGTLGAVFTGTTAFNLADQLYRTAYGLPHAPRDARYDTPFTPSKTWIEQNVAVPLGFAIGVSWVYDAYEKWHAIKLEEVARATDRLGKKLQDMRQQQSTSRG